MVGDDGQRRLIGLAGFTAPLGTRNFRAAGYLVYVSYIANEKPFGKFEKGRSFEINALIRLSALHELRVPDGPL